jgi:hypothetical protein
MIHLGTEMVRLRVIEADEERDRRILDERKARREVLLAQAAENPKPRLRETTWFRGRRTIVIA